MEVRCAPLSEIAFQHRLMFFPFLSLASNWQRVDRWCLRDEITEGREKREDVALRLSAWHGIRYGEIASPSMYTYIYIHYVPRLPQLHVHM